jgi:hypothetical protein
MLPPPGTPRGLGQFIVENETHWFYFLGETRARVKRCARFG